MNRQAGGLPHNFRRALSGRSRHWASCVRKFNIPIGVYSRWRRFKVELEGRPETKTGLAGANAKGASKSLAI